MKRVLDESGIAVIADESLVTAEQAESLIKRGVCDLFNIRISKCGGISGSLAIAKLAQQAGIKIQVGAQVGETGIPSAAGRALAASVPDIACTEGSFGTWLLSEDITFENVAFAYGDDERLRPYVERAKNGEGNALTSKPVLMFTQTSGSTGQPKLIPISKAAAITDDSPAVGTIAPPWTIRDVLAASCSVSLVPQLRENCGCPLRRRCRAHLREKSTLATKIVRAPVRSFADQGLCSQVLHHHAVGARTRDLVSPHAIPA
jgi:Enolase C-terminal domain-like/GH3 auxin-responsive promoter